MKNCPGGHPIAVDPTFNYQAYEITPVTYGHRLIEAKSKNVTNGWSHALLIGPTIIHHQKTQDVFHTGLRVIARKTQLSDAKFGVITDGETALINACKRNFGKSVDLRCTNRFKENCKTFLKSIGITGDIKQAPLLDIVFGKEGLVEADNKTDFTRRLEGEEEVIRITEQQLQEDTNCESPSFYDLKKKNKSVLRKLTKDRRLEGGVALDRNGNPCRVYTNQSETSNSVLAARKQSLGYSKKDDMSKSNFFIRNVWQSVVNEQEEEIQRALHGQSERFRLKEEARYLEVSTETWYN